MKRPVVYVVVVLGIIAGLAAAILITIQLSRPQLVGGPVAIVEGNAPEHGLLGIEFEPQPTAILKVTRVVRGTGADQAGIQPGDIITAIAGQPSSTTKDVLQILQDTEPDSVVRITIRRDGTEHELDVRLVSVTELILLSQE